MSKTAIELLEILGLLNKEGEVADIQELPDDRLHGIFDYYIQKRRESFSNELSKIRSENSPFSVTVSSLSASNSVASLMPYSVVYSKIIVDDPLFRLLAPLDQYDEEVGQFVGMNEGKAIDHNRIIRKIAYFARLLPLIKEGIIEVLPLNDLHKPKGARPFITSEDGFRSAVPSHVYDYVQENAIVYPVQRLGNQLVIVGEAVKEPCRGIEISFKDDVTSNGSAIYFMSSIEAVGENDSGGLIIRQTFDWDKPPRVEAFNAWVNQSINQTVRRRLKQTATELSVAESSGSVYITESDFESRICSLPTDPDLIKPDHLSAVNFLQATLPTLHNLSPEAIAKLRVDNSKQFDDFHNSLLEVSSELNDVREGFEQKAKQLFAKEIDPQIRNIEERWKKMQFATVGAVVTAGATFGLALLGAPSLPIAATLMLSTLAGGSTASTTIAEYRAGRRSPAFIWAAIS